MARTPSNQDLPLGTTLPRLRTSPTSSLARAMGRDDIFGGRRRRDRRHPQRACWSPSSPCTARSSSTWRAALTALLKELQRQHRRRGDLLQRSDHTRGRARRKMKEQALRLGWDTGIGDGIPYLDDESQETAREFHAACTPDLYLFNAQLRTDLPRPVRRHPPLPPERRQQRRPQRRPHPPSRAHGADLRASIEALLANQPPITPQTPSLGCNIKWG